VGLGTVALQDVPSAVAELARVVQVLGFPGIEISSNVNGIDLDHPSFEPFFSRAQELDALIFIHPYGFSHADRLKEFYLNNVIGQPLDSTVAVLRLIFSGVLERYPRLKICVGHGGGYVPFYLGRVDHAYRVRPECHTWISMPPSAYLKKLYFDTVVFEAGSLSYLVEQVGAEHVVLGTDYPFDMGEADPVGLISSMSGASKSDIEKILGRNSASLLRLDTA
jgi:aminocarboxymuconate-semialdehyde decarboxylase